MCTLLLSTLLQDHFAHLLCTVMVIPKVVQVLGGGGGGGGGGGAGPQTTAILG